MPSSADVLSPPAAFAADANGDGLSTLGDVTAWLAHLFFLPGDWALWAASKYAPPLAALLADGEPAYGSFVSGFIAAVFWSLVLAAVGTGYSYFVEMDRRATRGFERLFAGARRLARVAVRLLRTTLRRADAHSTSSTLDFTTRVELSTLELRVLRQLAELAPGYTFVPHELAHVLRLRVDEVRAPLAALVGRRLVIRTLGGSEGECGYALSAGGRGALMLRQLAPRSADSPFVDDSSSRA
jgi:hypothetical protein